MANLQAQASPLSATLLNFNVRVPVLAPLVAGARAPVLAEVPLLPGDLGSLADLGVIARHLFPAPAAAPTSAGHVGR